MQRLSGEVFEGMSAQSCKRVNVPLPSGRKVPVIGLGTHAPKAVNTKTAVQFNVALRPQKPCQTFRDGEQSAQAFVILVLGISSAN